MENNYKSVLREPFFEPILRKIRFKKVLPYLSNINYVCDIGCGCSAYFLNKISNRIKKGIGLDKNITSRQIGNIELLSFEFINKLPFGDNYFDLITMLAVLEHIENPDDMFKEIYRVLKPNGHLILTTPTPRAKPVLEFLSFKLKLIDKREILDHKRYWNKNELLNLLIDKKFKILKYSFFEFGLNSFIAARKILSN
jgi:ubiquinone/menaquinone biosynthesis C-methylase UbiE